MENYLAQIQQLPPAEQILLVERIWNDLHADSVVVRAWHQTEGERRIAELQADPSLTLTEEQMWKQVDELLDG